MKKHLLIIFIVLITTEIKSQSAKQVFESPSLPVLLASAKKVAILPFKVSISYKKMPKGLTLEQIKDNQSAVSATRTVYFILFRVVFTLFLYSLFSQA